MKSFEITQTVIADTNFSNNFHSAVKNDNAIIEFELNETKGVAVDIPVQELYNLIECAEKAIVSQLAESMPLDDMTEEIESILHDLNTSSDNDKVKEALCEELMKLVTGDDVFSL